MFYDFQGSGPGSGALRARGVVVWNITQTYQQATQDFLCLKTEPAVTSVDYNYDDLTYRLYLCESLYRAPR